MEERAKKDIEAIRETIAPGNWTPVTRTTTRRKWLLAAPFFVHEYNCIYLESLDWIIGEWESEIRILLLPRSNASSNISRFSGKSLPNFPSDSVLFVISLFRRETRRKSVTFFVSLPLSVFVPEKSIIVDENALKKLYFKNFPDIFSTLLKYGQEERISSYLKGNSFLKINIRYFFNLCKQSGRFIFTF